MVRKVLKNLIPDSIIDYRRNLIAKKEFAQWKNSGSPPPPPRIVKKKAIIKYQQKYKIDILIETGTCYGEMVEVLKKQFKKIISIEVSNELFNFVKARFKNDKHIELYEGDSGELLPSIIKKQNVSCLFWLDGHYSGGGTGKGELNTPIFKELKAIFESKNNHIILIDDARLFIGEDDYPTIEKLKEFVQEFNPNYFIEVEDDIIRIVN
jgi:hypothetical protein